MNRLLLRSSTAIAAAAAAALLFPSVASAAPGDLLSTKAAPNGWEIEFPDEEGQEAVHSAATVRDQDGSLEFVTTADADRKRLYHAAGGVAPAEILDNDLTFDHKGAGVAWQIRVTGAAVQSPPATETNGFATFVWDAPASEQATTVDAKNAPGWRSTRALPGIAKGESTTLAALIEAAGAGTKVDHYGILLQPGGPATAHVDNVKFNGQTTNFALNGPAGGSNGSLGGFGLADLIPGLPS